VDPLPKMGNDPWRAAKTRSKAAETSVPASVRDPVKNGLLSKPVEGSRGHHGAVVWLICFAGK